MEIQSVLHELGLKKSKGVVYLAALQTGSGTVMDIAKKAGLPRTTTNEIIQQLADLGLVSYSVQGRARVYTAESPDKLKLLLKERERRVQTILPELRSMANTAGLRPRVRMYDGIEGVKAVFEDTLTVNDKWLSGILSMEDLYKTPGKTFMDDYVQRRIGSGISLRVIRSQVKEVEETWPSSANEARELRYAPEGLVFPMTLYLYDGKVGIIGTQKEHFGMIIESRDLYQTQKNLFETLWQVSRISKLTPAPSSNPQSTTP
jgi:HTH-type transcriptional regulator, sugar sensing transcriptional regulator